MSIKSDMGKVFEKFFLGLDLVSGRLAYKRTFKASWKKKFGDFMFVTPYGVTLKPTLVLKKKNQP